MVADKEAAIFAATLDLVSRRGFHDAPMSLIARQAGVGVGTIYRYFENKEDLISQLYSRLRAQMADAMLTGYAAHLPFRERFRRLWFNTARFHMDHPLETAFLEQYANSPFLKPETPTIQADAFQPLAEFAERGIYEGILKDLPAELFASLTLEVAISLAKKHSNGIINLDEATLEQAVGACWDAIKR